MAGRRPSGRAPRRRPSRSPAGRGTKSSSIQLASTFNGWRSTTSTRGPNRVAIHSSASSGAHRLHHDVAGVGRRRPAAPRGGRPAAGAPRPRPPSHASHRCVDRGPRVERAGATGRGPVPRVRPPASAPVQSRSKSPPSARPDAARGATSRPESGPERERVVVAVGLVARRPRRRCARAPGRPRSSRSAARPRSARRTTAATPGHVTGATVWPSAERGTTSVGLGSRGGPRHRHDDARRGDRDRQRVRWRCAWPGTRRCCCCRPRPGASPSTPTSPAGSASSARRSPTGGRGSRCSPPTPSSGRCTPTGCAGPAGSARRWRQSLAVVYPGERTLHLACSDIGPGLFIQHGFATIVAARRVGRNCWINQQVTIGFTRPEDRPTIGDDVFVYAGAKVLGDDHGRRRGARRRERGRARRRPAGCTAVGVPARILPPKPERVRRQG